MIPLKDVADQLQAELVVTETAADIRISGVSTLAAAGPDELTFVRGESNVEEAATSRAGAFLVSEDVRVPGRPCLVVPHLWTAMLAALEIWYPDEPAPEGVHPSAVVHPDATVGAGVSIGALAVVEEGAVIEDGVEIGPQCFVGRDVVIGEDSLLHPGVRVLERVRLGRRVILHSGVVLGADGFGYEIMDGQAVKIPQVGTVVIEDDVEIGANSCIDRAFLTETRIGAGSKIDNLAHIAHNCRIGRLCGIAAQVGVAGSTTIGDGCMIWGQAGIADHARIGNRVEVLAQSGIQRAPVPDGARLFGYPAVDAKLAARIRAAQIRLPDAFKRLRELEKKVENLVKDAGSHEDTRA